MKQVTSIPPGLLLALCVLFALSCDSEEEGDTIHELVGIWDWEKSTIINIEEQTVDDVFTPEETSVGVKYTYTDDQQFIYEWVRIYDEVFSGGTWQTAEDTLSLTWNSGVITVYKYHIQSNKLITEYKELNNLKVAEYIRKGSS